MTNLPDDPKRRDRISRMVEMRLNGNSYRVIGEEFGVSAQTACKTITKHIHEYVPVEDLQALRAKEADILDKLDASAIGMLRQMHRVNEQQVEMGDRLAYVPEDLLRVYDRILKIQERRAKLLGLDAAMKIDAQISVHRVDEEVEQLVADLLGGGQLLSTEEDMRDAG